MIFIYTCYWTIYSLLSRYFGFKLQLCRHLKVADGGQSSQFCQEHVCQGRLGRIELRLWSIEPSWWQWQDSKSDRCSSGDTARHISRSDGNIGEEHLHYVLSDGQLADVWKNRSIVLQISMMLSRNQSQLRNGFNIS